MIADYIVDIINQAESRSGRRPTKIVCNATTLRRVQSTCMTCLEYDCRDMTYTLSFMGIPFEVNNDLDDALIYVLSDEYGIADNLTDVFVEQSIISHPTQAFQKHNDTIDALTYSFRCYTDVLSPPALYDDPISDDELDAILNGGGFRATK